MSLITKLIRGSSVNVLEHGLKVLVMFVVTPLMIHHLGNEDYGVWLLALAIIAYLRLFDLGLSFAGSRFLGRSLGAEDREEYHSLVCRLVRLYSVAGLVVMVLAAIIIGVTPIFLEESGMSSMIRILVAGFGIVTALRFFTRIFEVILKSHVRYDLIGLSSILKTLIQGVAVVILLTAGHGLVALLLVHILVDAMDQLCMVFFAKRLEPKLRLRGIMSGKVGTAELLRYSGSAMVTNVGHSLRQGIDPMIITHVSGVATVPLFSVGARFLTLFTDVINSIFGGNLIAAFSQLHGRGDADVLSDRFLTVIRYSTIVACVGGSGLIIFGPAFIERWIGPDFSVSGKVLWILAPAITLSLCQYPAWGLFYSQNKQGWLAFFTLLFGTFNLILSLFLASRIGWMGVVWATCIEVTIAYGLVMPRLVQRVCSIPAKAYLLQMAVPGAVVVSASVVYGIATNSLLLPTYNRLCLLSIGYVIIIFVMIWLFVFSKLERNQLWNMVKPPR